MNKLLNYCDMRLTWTCFLKDMAVADAATMANSKRTKVFIVVVVVVVVLVSFSPFFSFKMSPYTLGFG